jgi:transposase
MLIVLFFKKNMEGIKGYWKYDKLTSAGMEGFNNKIGCLNRQAYGYRDEEYFKLKIFDLPAISRDKAI